MEELVRSNNLTHFQVTLGKIVAEDFRKIDDRLTSGKTPFLAVWSSGNLEYAQHLFEKGANIVVKSEIGEKGNALYYAAQNGHLNIVKFLAEETWFPMKQSADIWGKNAFHCACNKGHLEIVRYLKENTEADPTEKNKISMTALHYACFAGHVEIARYLVESCELDPKEVDREGQNALHFAAASGNLDLVKYLVEVCGMNIFTADKRNENASDKAREKHEEVLGYLEYYAFKQYRINQRWKGRKPGIWLYTTLRSLGEVPKAKTMAPRIDRADPRAKMKTYAARANPTFKKSRGIEIQKVPVGVFREIMYCL